jgi:hypothetical protein
MIKSLRILITVSSILFGLLGCGTDKQTSKISATESIGDQASFVAALEARYGSTLVYSDFKLPAGYSFAEAYADTLKAEALAEQYLYKAKATDAAKDPRDLRAALVSKAFMTIADTLPNDLGWYNWRGKGKQVKAFLAAMDKDLGASFHKRGAWMTLKVGFSFRSYDEEIFNRDSPWGDKAVALPHWLECIINGDGGDCG